MGHTLGCSGNLGGSADGSIDRMNAVVVFNVPLLSQLSMVQTPIASVQTFFIYIISSLGNSTSFHLEALSSTLYQQALSQSWTVCSNVTLFEMHKLHIASTILLLAITSLALPLPASTENVVDELEIAMLTGRSRDQQWCFLKRMAKPPSSEVKDPPVLGPYC